jgi:hypothetical protein
MTAILKKTQLTNEQKMWNVIRIMRCSLDAPMVAMTADVGRDVALAYLRKLYRADVLTCTTPAAKAGGFAVYRLTIDPGPYPPGSQAARVWAASKSVRRTPRTSTRAERAERLMGHVHFLRLRGFESRALLIEDRLMGRGR